MKITIVGAGISGLTLAYGLQKENIDYELLEADTQVGGNIRSKKIDKYLLELGPNSILGGADLQHFIEEIGLKEEILLSNAVSKNRFIFRNGKYRKLPSKPQDLLFNTFFSWKTKFAIYQELRKPAQNIENETLSHFFERRFSKEIVDYALAPFVAGIYAGNPDELLLEATFPFLKEYEQKFGSIIKGLMRNKNTERRQSFSFKAGMDILPKGIAAHLKNLNLNCQVNQISKKNDELVLQTSKGEINTNIIVLALPALASAKILQSWQSDWAESLQKINYPPMVAVHTAYPKNALKAKLDGFGGLNPQIEQQFASGSIWSSSVFEGRCPDDEVLFTSFVGGRGNEHKTENMEAIGEKAHLELTKQYQINSKPTFQHIFKWEKAIPQYDKYILEAWKVADEMEKSNIFVCSNWKDGVSLSDCVKKAQNLAIKLKELQKNF